MVVVVVVVMKRTKQFLQTKLNKFPEHQNTIEFFILAVKFCKFLKNILHFEKQKKYQIHWSIQQPYTQTMIQMQYAILTQIVEFIIALERMKEAGPWI